MAADLVSRAANVIVTPGGVAAALAAKAETATIPIVFVIGVDPVQAGLVVSLNRPGGNVTGITSMNSGLAAKQLGLLHQLLQRDARFVVLVNSSNPQIRLAVADVKAAAAAMGQPLDIVIAKTNREITPAFKEAVQKRADAILISPDPLFSSRPVQLATLAARHAMPAIYALREFAESGGLISYGSNFTDMFRQAGTYVARILKGEKPADLPILQATKFELVINLHGAAAAWPLAARAQQTAMPVIGVLSSTSPGGDVHRIAAFRKGLREVDYIEGQNVAIEYRGAASQYDRLPGLATDLVRDQVSLIVTLGGAPAARAAKAATATIPIVFYVGGDPVEQGLVASLNRPGGNLTGVSSLNTELGPKRLELLHEAVPKIATIAVLLNPTNPLAPQLSKDLRTAAHTMGLELHALNASTDREIDNAFTSLLRLRADALVIGTDAFFNNQSEQIATLALRHAVPSIYQYRAFTTAGGLMSYGGEITDLYRQVGVYAGRILKGEKPAELPVQQSTKVELIINIKTAKALGITVPISLLARADEVIE